jgi:hypothetical protein
MAEMVRPTKPTPSHPSRGFQESSVSGARFEATIDEPTAEAA